jgi:predicted Zn-dependent peptidase
MLRKFYINRGRNMLITLIIVGGITLISIVAVVGDYLTKVKTVQPSINVKEVIELQKRVEELESIVRDQNKKIEHLETDISFTNKLLEDKTK